jgi:hypothetical protein
MRRHAIIGRFGPADQAHIPAAGDEVSTRLEFVLSKRLLEHDIGSSLNALSKMGVFPSEIGLDLLVLAAHVQAADTRISRSTESQDGWTREIRIVVPVSDPARWNAAIPLLLRILNFLTGDRWTICFRPRPAGFEKIVFNRPRRLISPPFDYLALFSGGLDSLIGAIDTLKQGKTPLLVSHAGDGATSDAQTKLFQALKKNYPTQNFDRLRLWMDFRNWTITGVDPEKTTRGRSFLFFAAGIYAGTGLNGSFVLHAPENGLIALNVPLDPLRLGAFSTRTTHPFYIARWNELLGVLGIQGRIENPYWYKTKGEMAAACSNSALLRKIASKSLSCSSPTKGRFLKLGTGHCGFCLPCLIRRAALLEANDTTTYALPDLTARVLDTRDADGQQIRSFQYAIEKLRQHPELAPLYIHKPGPLSDESPDRQAALADVYARGLAELAKLLAGVRAGPS